MIVVVILLGFIVLIIGVGMVVDGLTGRSRDGFLSVAGVIVALLGCVVLAATILYPHNSGADKVQRCVDSGGVPFRVHRYGSAQCFYRSEP